MKRFAVAATVAIGMSVVWGGVASADADDHNCAGRTSSSFAAALGKDFGAVVSAYADLQLVDNFGLANCGAPPRQNP